MKIYSNQQEYVHWSCTVILCSLFNKTHHNSQNQRIKTIAFSLKLQGFLLGVMDRVDVIHFPRIKIIIKPI